MVRYLSLYFTFLVLFFYGYVLQAQKAPLKWGKVSDEEENWKPMTGSDDQGYVILYDYGVLKYSDRKNISLTRHVRIRYDNDMPGDRSIIYLPVNKTKNGSITRLKAQLLQKSGSGKYESFELDDSEINHSEEQGAPVQLFFKGIKTGTIIEYQYTWSGSDTREPVRWDFQTDVPTMYSEVRLAESESVKVNVYYQGPRLTNKYRNEAADRWILENTNALSSEPYSPCPGDFADNISFRLSGTFEKGPTYGLDRQLEFNPYESTWSLKGVEILKSEGFVSYVGNGAKKTGIPESVLDAGMNDREKARELYEYVTNHIRWNSAFSLYPDASFDKIQLSKTGNGSAINLYLIVLLREAGFKAAPVLISTRGHGKVEEGYPALSAFNHVVAGVMLYGKYLLMDASDVASPYNLLPVDDLNGEGLLVGLSASEWVALETDKPKTSFSTTSMRWDTNGSRQLSGQAQFNNYAGIEVRRKLLKQENPSRTMSDLFAGAHLSTFPDSLEIENLSQTHLPLKMKFEFKESYSLDQEQFSVSPLLVSSFNVNPFTAERRLLPVDFVVAVEETNSFTLIIPEGFQVVDAPQPYELFLPGKKGSLTYTVSATSEKLKIKSTLKIDETYFTTAEYPELKTFFQKYFEKIGEVIVLSRAE